MGSFDDLFNRPLQNRPTGRNRKLLQSHIRACQVDPKCDVIRLEALDEFFQTLGLDQLHFFRVDAEQQMVSDPSIVGHLPRSLGCPVTKESTLPGVWADSCKGPQVSIID